MRNNRFLLFVLTVLISACGMIKMDDGTRDSITISRPNMHRVEGTFIEYGKAIEYFGVQRSERDTEVQMIIENKVVNIHLTQYDTGALYLEIQGRGHIFDEDEVLALKAFIERYAEFDGENFDFEQLPLHEQILLRTADYFSSFPAGRKFGTETFQWAPYDKNGERKIECLKRGEYVQAMFTLENGLLIDNVWAEVGKGNSQRGQCGHSLLATGWTKDCFNHDTCDVYTRKMGIEEIIGGMGPNCLDEFRYCIDDFFFTAFWKCTGK